MRDRLIRAPLPSFGDKVRRALWGVVWATLFRFSPVPLHGWRRFLLRLFGARIGPRAEAYPTTWIWAPWQLTMEEGAGLGPGVDCYCVAPVLLKKDANVSQRAFLCTASHDPRDPTFPLVLGAIVIGRGAWVAAEAFVGPGVSIGDDAVASARAVVIKNVAENTIVAGNPARPIGTRYTRPQTPETQNQEPQNRGVGETTLSK